MNVCLFFNRSYVLWHALALDLKKRYGAQKISAYLYGKKPYRFISQQKDIVYDAVLVDDILATQARNETVDLERLKKKEQEYGIPYLWQNFTADRFMVNNWPRNFYPIYDPIFNQHEIQQQLQYRIKKIEEFLDAARPDFIVLSGAGAMGVNLLCRIAEKRGIQIIVIETPRLGNKISLTSSLYGLFPHVDEKFKKVRAGEAITTHRDQARVWLSEFRNKPIKPFWSNPAEKFTLQPILFFKNLARNVVEVFDRSFPRIYAYSVFDYLKRNALLWLNTRRTIRYDSTDEHDEYAFFPLHYEPELALMMYAPFYTDQLWLIRNIAQSLPIHFKLYVKEHPAMGGLRDPRFYAELKKIPNVKLIHPATDSIPIIRNSKLVLVITSTAGWEAAFFKKPVITFGSILFNVLPSVYRCTELEYLPILVQKALDQHQHNEEELVDLISVILEGSFDIDLPSLWEAKDYRTILESQDLQLLSDQIVKFYRTDANSHPSA